MFFINLQVVCKNEENLSIKKNSLKFDISKLCHPSNFNFSLFLRLVVVSGTLCFQS